MRTTTTTTKAQQLADLFDDDGQRWRLDDGRELGDVARSLGAKPLHLDDGGTRFQFSDASAVIAVGGGWDLALDGEREDCACWLGAAGSYPETAGHNASCPVADDLAEPEPDVELDEYDAADQRAALREEDLAATADHNLNAYTSRYDDATTPRVELAAGESVLSLEQGDGREWDAFQRRMREAGLRLEWDEYVSAEHGDLYELVEAEA